MPVHGWSEKSQKWFKFYLRTERRASTIASGRTVKQSLSQENVLRSSVRRKYEQCNCIREHILEDYLYVSRINHFKHRLLPALLSNIAGCSAIITHVDAYSLSCCLWLYFCFVILVFKLRRRWFADWHAPLSSSHAVNLLRSEMISWYVFCNISLNTCQLCHPLDCTSYTQSLHIEPLRFKFWCFDTTSAPNLSSPLRFSRCAGRIRLGSFACCQTLTMLMFVVNEWRCIICANMFVSTCLYILKKIRTHTYSFDIEKALAMQRPPKEVHITCCSICSIHLWFHTCCLQCSTSWKQMSNARKMHRIKRCKQSMSVLQQFLLCIDEMTTSPFSSLYLQHWLSKSYKEFASRKFRLWQWCAKVETHQWIVFFLCVIILLLGLAVMDILPFPSKGKSKLKKSRDPNVYP